MNQPNELPRGLWEQLLPPAFTLMDEVAKHGMSDPFFTFGGGTVLMLRHNHRLSKDIDFFVPSPQTLGYVSPRLSSVAEDLCNGDYKETFAYVKLHLEQGEIDVVASPNLLQDQDAFEVWQLLGRSLRVETAAEIVAKKMYHRGNEGTARDLFDLSMTIEREPDGLIAARPFFYRHLDALSKALESPPQAMMDRFAAIETLTYRPTFGHVVDVVRSYFIDLQAAREQSAEEARALAADSGLMLKETNVSKGEYCGPIVHRTERHAVQSIGRNEAVVHDIAALGHHDANAFKPSDTLLRVHYQNGHAKISSVARTQAASKKI